MSDEASTVGGGRVVPVDPRVRLVIARWPDDAPRGAVSSFCAKEGISRNTFYKLRARALAEGEAAVLEPRSRRPRSSPRRISDEVANRALEVRSALEGSGLDAGPISVHDKMVSMGLPAPSPASLARIFRAAGVARAEPSKRPRAAWRRFVYPAPNACWQMDATGYVLSGGRTVTIFQLIDDHSRLSLASLVAEAETSAGAIATFDAAVARWGVPQRLLTDNGVAFNPTRRGVRGALVEHVRALGVEPITGKPYHPTTQGKNERFHQTLLRYLNAQPLADTIAGLQEQVDAFDHVYNHRPHQGLPGRITPAQAWDATAPAAPPRPAPDQHSRSRPQAANPPTTSTSHDVQAGTATRHQALPGSGQARRRLRRTGLVSFAGVSYLVSPPLRQPGHHRDLGRKHHHLRRRRRRGPGHLPTPQGPHHHLRQPPQHQHPHHTPTPATSTANVTEVLTHQASPMS